MGSDSPWITLALLCLPQSWIWPWGLHPRPMTFGVSLGVGAIWDAPVAIGKGDLQQDPLQESPHPGERVALGAAWEWVWGNLHALPAAREQQTSWCSQQEICCNKCKSLFRLLLQLGCTTGVFQQVAGALGSFLSSR